MTQPTLEERLARLESHVAVLTERLAGIERGPAPGAKDWRQWIGAFTDDEGMKDVFTEAMKLREADRQRAYRKSTRKPSKRS